MEPGHNIFMDPRLIRGKKEEFDLNKLKAIHQDLTDYLGVPVEKIARDYWNKRETTDKEQQRLLENASTEKELLDYYRTTRQYLYELTSWEAQKSKQRESRKLYLFFRKFHVKKILDFGGGAGGLCIYLNNHGLSCDYLDVPGETYNFAKWRFNKYKIKPRVIGALKNISPLNYEAVIAYDVFEHIFDLVDTIRKINNWLIPGGYLISISTFSGRGIHLIKNEIYQNFTNFNDLLSNNGFEFWGRLKADHFSNLLNKIGFKYPLFSIRLSKKPKYGGNLIVHRKKPNLI